MQSADKEQRRLEAVTFTDIVDYSAPTQRNEGFNFETSALPRCLTVFIPFIL